MVAVMKATRMDVKESLQSQAQMRETGDFFLIAYAGHMAATARSDEVRRVFCLYAEQERQRLTTY